jgi:hypothetical protein
MKDAGDLFAGFFAYPRPNGAFPARRATAFSQAGLKASLDRRYWNLIPYQRKKYRKAV